MERRSHVLSTWYYAYICCRVLLSSFAVSTWHVRYVWFVYENEFVCVSAPMLCVRVTINVFRQHVSLYRV